MSFFETVRLFEPVWMFSTHLNESCDVVLCTPFCTHVCAHMISSRKSSCFLRNITILCQNPRSFKTSDTRPHGCYRNALKSFKRNVPKSFKRHLRCCELTQAYIQLHLLIYTFCGRIIICSQKVLISSQSLWCFEKVIHPHGAFWIFIISSPTAKTMCFDWRQHLCAARTYLYTVLYSLWKPASFFPNMMSFANIPYGLLLNHADAVLPWIEQLEISATMLSHAAAVLTPGHMIYQRYYIFFPNNMIAFCQNSRSFEFRWKCDSFKRQRGWYAPHSSSFREPCHHKCEETTYAHIAFSNAYLLWNTSTFCSGKQTLSWGSIGRVERWWQQKTWKTVLYITYCIL